MVDRQLEHVGSLDDALRQSGNAPLGAYAFARTGAFCHVGVQAERGPRYRERMGLPLAARPAALPAILPNATAVSSPLPDR